MPRVMNLVMTDLSDPKNAEVFVESFDVRSDVADPEKALRDAVNEFVQSGSAASTQALAFANGYYNWGDAMSSIPVSLFSKHGLTRLYRETVDVHVDHNELLGNPPGDALEATNEHL